MLSISQLTPHQYLCDGGTITPIFQKGKLRHREFFFFLTDFPRSYTWLVTEIRVEVRQFGFRGRSLLLFHSLSHEVVSRDAGLKFRFWGPSPRDSDLVGPGEGPVSPLKLNMLLQGSSPLFSGATPSKTRFFMRHPLKSTCFSSL